MQSGKPKIGLALSGGAGRAAAHFAVMDVLLENGIKPDIIVGCSSGALVAVAYGAGKRDYLYNHFLKMDRKKVFKLLSFWGARGALFHLHNADPELRILCDNKNIEELDYGIGITAADVESGELITMTSGDTVKALKASVAVPGFFEPEVIDNRILLEGGLVNIVPTVPTRQLGADIVIGVDVAKAKFFYQKKMPLFRLIRRWRKLLGIQFVQHEIIRPLTSKIFAVDKDSSNKKRRVPNAFRIFFWAVDRSYDIEAEWNEEQQAADILIQPPVKDTAKLELSQAEYIYKQGRKATLEALPMIKQLIAEYEKQKVRA